MTAKNIPAPITSGFNPQPPSAGSRRVPYGSFLSPALVAGAALLFGLAGSFRAAAINFPITPFGGDLQSFGCFRVVVNPNFLWLMDPDVLNGYPNPYPGYASPNLTSPGLFDNHTIVAESKGLNDVPSVTGPVFYPVIIGGLHNSPAGNASLYLSASDFSMPDGNALSFPFFGWQYPPPAMARRTMLTEIQRFNLEGDFNSNPSAPCPPGTSSLLGPPGPVLVNAGWFNLLDPARRSLGMVQRLDTALPGNDFPAKSLFDVYVEITLPPIVNTKSMAAFPPLPGAVLYNDVLHPLWIENDNLLALPTISNAVVYSHSGQSQAVPLKFKYDQPDGNGGFWWHHDQEFGNLILAGHGVFDPCAKSTANWDNFIAKILGTVGHAQPAGPVGGMFPNPDYPWSTCTYGMTMGTNFAGQPLDELTFPSTTLSASYLTVSNFQNPITLPTFGNSVIYSNTGSTMTLSWSIDGVHYTPTNATGTIVVQIVNTNVAVNGVVTYDTELQNLDFSGTAFFGSFMIRESPTKTSSGKHIVQSGGPGCRIAGYFDASLEFSANNGATWTPADMPVRLNLGNPPCGASVEPLYAWTSGPNTILDWANPSYTLQYSTSLTPTAWVDVPGTPPLSVPTTGPNKYFRLICQ